MKESIRLFPQSDDILLEPIFPQSYRELTSKEIDEINSYLMEKWDV